MSLINEALRRARLEAARQEAARRGEAPPVLPAALPDRRRLPWGLFALAVVIGIVLAATAVWLLGWNRQQAPAPREATTGTVAAKPQDAARPPGSATTAAHPMQEARVASGNTASPTEGTTSVERPSAPSRPAETRTASKPHEGAPRPESKAVKRVTAPEHEASASASSLVDGYTYVGSIDLKGHHVVLGGIAWSSSHPTALLNDAAVGKGDEVAGVRVLAVEPDRVKLGAEGKTFFLRLP